MRTLLERDNPLLRQKAELVNTTEFQSTWLKELINELFLIMKEKGSVGVAAPQIGVSKRVIVFSSAYTKRRKIEIPIPDTTLINPTLKMLSDEKEYGYEGCLNGGGMIGEVPRAKKIEYTGYDLEGNLVKKETSGLEARILQHEIDHLDGILFFDRIENKETLMTYEEYQNRQPK